MRLFVMLFALGAISPAFAETAKEKKKKPVPSSNPIEALRRDFKRAAETEELLKRCEETKDKNGKYAYRCLTEPDPAKAMWPSRESCLYSCLPPK